MVHALDAEYNRLITELSDVNGEIARHRATGSADEGHNWHQALEPILEKHRRLVARLREIAEIRQTES